MIPADSWRIELAMIRQRAAARCGLPAYPGELIRAYESVVRSQRGQLAGRSREQAYDRWRAARAEFDRATGGAWL